MATTRCKFTVQSITMAKSSKPKLGSDGEPLKSEAGYLEYEPWVQPTVNLSPVKDDDPHSENGKFWLASPSGNITISINNPLGAEVFEVGEDYYIDFTKAGV